MSAAKKCHNPLILQFSVTPAVFHSDTMKRFCTYSTTQCTQTETVSEQLLTGTPAQTSLFSAMKE